MAEIKPRSVRGWMLIYDLGGGQLKGGLILKKKPKDAEMEKIERCIGAVYVDGRTTPCPRDIEAELGLEDKE